MTLFLPIGIPGSGKSYLGEQHFKPSEIVSLDDFRYRLTDDMSCQDVNSEAVWLASKIVDIRLTRDLDVYFDATNLQPKFWPNPRHHHIVLIIMDTTNNVSLERNANRERVVPEGAMIRMSQRLKSLDFNALSREHPVIDIAHSNQFNREEYR